MAKLRFNPEKTLTFADPREIPTYGVAEAAYYLRMPPATLRTWVLGRHYPTGKGRKKFQPLIDIADQENRLLSFINLAEAHVLSACRRIHNIPLHKVRPALDFIASTFQSRHPLIEKAFETDGVSLFVDHLGTLIDVSARGQIIMRQCVEQHLRRLERKGAQVVRLYPFTREALDESPRSVFIDPRVSFGRPVLATIRVPTSAISVRYWAGETIEHLAADYDCGTLDVQEAIRCEGRPKAAA